MAHFAFLSLDRENERMSEVKREGEDNKKEEELNRKVMLQKFDNFKIFTKISLAKLSC